MSELIHHKAMEGYIHHMDMHWPIHLVIVVVQERTKEDILEIGAHVDAVCTAKAIGQSDSETKPIPRQLIDVALLVRRCWSTC